MPGRSSSAAADPAVLTDEQLPTFDGSQIALANWLRELQRYEHLLPAELAYWLVTGSANTAAGKVAVFSAQHAHLLYRNAVEVHNFNVVNPPPVEDKFLSLYNNARDADIAISDDGTSELSANPNMNAPIGSQFQISPVRLMQLDLQYRNILLGLITSPGRKAHYAGIAGNSGAKLMRQLLADKNSSLSAYIQDPHYAHLKAKLRQVLGMKLSCLSQEEFNNIRDQVQEINTQLPDRERMTDIQQCDHFRSLITDLNSVGLTIRLDNDLMINQVPYGDLPLTLGAITRTLTRAMFEEQQRAAEAGSALQGKSRPSKQPDARKRVRPPCTICGKDNHEALQCYQNVNADEATLKRAPMSSPAGKEWARRNPGLVKPPPRLSNRPPRSRLPQFLRRSRARKTWTTSFWRLSTRAAAPTSTSRVATRSPPSPVPPACRLPHQSLSLGPPMPCLGPLCPFVPLITTYLVAMLQPLVHITSAAELIALLAHPPHLPLGGPAMRSSSAHHRCVERACQWA